MSANWQKVGGIEVCEGTDGVVGVMSSQEFLRRWDRHGQELPSFFSQEAGFSMRDKFEKYHCQPRHRLIECADGAVMVLSVDEVDGKPMRGAMVTDVGVAWWVDRNGKPSGNHGTKEQAIAAAVAHVTAR